MPRPITTLFAPDTSSGFRISIDSDDCLNISGMNYEPQSYTVSNYIDGIWNGTSVALKITYDSKDIGDHYVIVFPGEEQKLRETVSNTKITIYPCVKLNLSTSIPT